MNQRQLVARAPDVTWALFDDDVLCYCTGALHHLGPAATAAWLLLATPRRVCELADALHGGHDGAAAVEDLLNALRDLGLVANAASPSRQV